MKTQEEIEEYITQIKAQDTYSKIMQAMNYIQVQTLEWVLESED